MINIFKDKPIYNILKSIRIYMFELYEQISWPFNKCCPSFYRILLGKQLQVQETETKQPVAQMGMAFSAVPCY